MQHCFLPATRAFYAGFSVISVPSLLKWRESVAWGLFHGSVSTEIKFTSHCWEEKCWVLLQENNTIVKDGDKVPFLLGGQTSMWWLFNIPWGAKQRPADPASPSPSLGPDTRCGGHCLRPLLGPLSGAYSLPSLALTCDTGEQPHAGLCASTAYCLLHQAWLNLGYSTSEVTG